MVGEGVGTAVDEGVGAAVGERVGAVVGAAVAGTGTCWTGDRLPSLPTSRPMPSGASAIVSPWRCSGSGADPIGRHVVGSSRTSRV